MRPSLTRDSLSYNIKKQLLKYIINYFDIVYNVYVLIKHK